MLYNQLQTAVKEAQEKVGRFTFEELIYSMPVRCQAVIDANGLFTKYQNRNQDCFALFMLIAQLSKA